MTGRVVRVIDGDTIHVRVAPRRIEKVRYIGVNAPEVPHPHVRGWREGGPEALQVNRRLVAAKDARLELDASPRDSWGRIECTKSGSRRVTYLLPVVNPSR